MKRIAGMLMVVVAILTAGFSGNAQTTTLPKNYTVTESIGYIGNPFSLVIARKGNLGYMKHWKPGTKEVSSLTVVKIDKGEEVTWDPNMKPIQCGKETFKGSWGDPFEDGADMMKDLNKMNPKQTGTEPFLGLTANVLEADGPQGMGKLKVWEDAKSGGVLKITSTQPGAAAKVFTEITQLSLTAPSDALFKTPPECDATASASGVPSDDEAIKQLTNDDASNYVRAVTSAGSKDSCTMLYKVVQAGTMQPITTGITVSMDVGTGDPGTGVMHKVVSAAHNGVYRIVNIPSQFNIETDFGDSSGTSYAMIHRQCFGPETVLLYVIKNPAKATDGGDYLWVKSGKYAKK